MFSCVGRRSIFPIGGNARQMEGTAMQPIATTSVSQSRIRMEN